MSIIKVMNKSYRIVKENKDGWNEEAFTERYSEVLDRYDYIVGDWGYSQLRLKGFLREGHPKATKDTSIAGLQDYLNEYCNFGCAYFVIEKLSKHDLPLETQKEPQIEIQNETQQEQVELQEEAIHKD